MKMITRVISVVLMLTILVSTIMAASFSAVAEETEDVNSSIVGGTIVDSGVLKRNSNISWKLYDDGTLVVSGKGEMIFNDSSESPWVTLYDDSRDYEVTRAIINDGITNIGFAAFYYCRNLKSITIPDSVTSIGGCAFYHCESLTSITIPDSVTSVGRSAFEYCLSLTSITIPDGATSIGEYAFYGCSSLTSITIPDSVTSIGRSVFTHCESLTSITIPKSLTSIGISVFCYCTNLKSITIHNRVTSIEENAFYGCTSLADVYYVGTDSQWRSMVFSWGNDCLKSATVFYLDEDEYEKQSIKREDGFNFYLNQDSNNLCIGDVVKLQVGYYKDNIVDLSSKGYIYTVSDSSVIKLSSSRWLDEYGDCMNITALKEGVATITATHPTTGETCTLEIYVSPRESGYNFYNIPKMSIEPGRTTNFYNYSGMVVDDFSYVEHKNDLGVTDYYNVTMTVYNSVNLYGVVSSHRADGSVYGYYILDKMDSHDSSFSDSLKTLYYSSGDLWYLINNRKYYSGKSISTETKVDIAVPVGGYISISNNISVSDMANLVNFLYLLFDTVSIVKDVGDWVGDGVKIDKGIKDQVVTNILTDILANKAIKDKLLSCLKDSVAKEFKGLSFKNDDLIGAFANVRDQLVKNVGLNIIDALEDEICSVMGIVSIGESVATKVLPTGWIIEGLYTFSDVCDFVVFFNEYCVSNGRYRGVYIYAPKDTTKFYSNGISIDTQDDMSETVVHAYTVVDTSIAGINENTFGNQSAYYFEKYKTYNITLYKNGVETQPNLPVTVRIPIPDTLNRLNRSALKVYRNNDDGTLTDMNAYVDGNDMVFVTEHFSYYSVVDESMPSTSDELAFSGASLTLQDNICINFKTSESLFTEVGYENPFVLFEMNGEKFTVSDYRVVDGKYVFDFTDVSPANMNDTIKATLYAEYDGTTYVSETREYSVADYCYNMLSKCNTDEYAELRTLLVDLLNYGAATQIYADRNTANLVNASLSEDQLAWGTWNAPEYFSVMNLNHAAIENPSVKWKSGGLNLKDCIEMRFKISADGYDDLKVVAETDSHSWTIYADEFEETTGGCYVYFDGLNAGQMSEPVYLTVYRDDTAVSNTICYSIESYAYAMQSSSDTKLTNLLEAMMKYGCSAYAYVN